jgi:WD40 repeat protein
MNSYLGLVTVFSEPDDILYCTIDAPDALYPSHLSFSGVGDSILVAGDTEAYLFAVPSGAVVSTLAANTESISCVKVAPDGSFCVLGHYNGTASVMDSETGSITATLSGHVASVSSVSISLESDLIATSSNTLSDHTIRLWNLDGSLYGIINDTNSGGTVQFLSKALIEALTGIDQGGIFCGYGSVVTFYNYAGTSMTRFGPEFGHWSPIIAMDVAANGYNGRVYTASDDGVVYSWYLY